MLSICTGGGGLDLGVELAIPGARSVCMVEREAFAVAHLVSAMEQGLLAPAPIWSDARTFDGRAWRGCVDGLIGGIPCQPHSLAGRKQGQLDERDLWSDARRIIVQSRCWFALIENVGGMLSAGADEVAGAERVWRDLRKLGFAVEIGLFTAAEVGASHERERVFILGVSGVGLADAFGEGRERGEWTGAPEEWHGEVAPRPTSEFRGARPSFNVAHARGDRQQWRAESNIRQIEPEQQASRRRDAERRDRALVHADAGAPEIREGNATICRQPASDRAAGGGADEHAVGDAICGGHDRWADDAIRRSVERTAAEGTVGYPLFPPPPDALSSWAGVLASAPELEPAFRRVADGLASRLDVGRVDRLRMLGNGVVPLQAAYAVRTLATRLAERGSAGAARLVRMMEAAE